MCFSERATVFRHDTPKEEIDAARARGEIVVVLKAPPDYKKLAARLVDEHAETLRALADS